MASESQARRISCVAYCTGEPKGKNKFNDPGTIPKPILYHGLRSPLLARSKGSVVMIVFVSGMVEAYESAVPAYAVMEKYPGLCLTRPQFFTRPHDSLVRRKEMLLPGQKFYLVPEATVRKLRQNSPKEESRAKEVRIEDAVVDKPTEVKSDGAASDERASPFPKRSDKCAEVQRPMPIMPAIKKWRMRQGLPDRWKPSLATVMENSP